MYNGGSPPTAEISCLGDQSTQYSKREAASGPSVQNGINLLMNMQTYLLLYVINFYR